MERPFTKYEGAGNDFILLDGRGGDLPDSGLVRRLCDRRFGIGADGLMLLAAGDREAEATMHFYNADGSRGAMCGNGARCFALFASHTGVFQGDRFRFRAEDGVHRTLVRRLDSDRAEVTLTLRDVERAEPLSGGWLLDTGVPHFVRFLDTAATLHTLDVRTLGRRLRHRIRSREGGVNVNFAFIAEPGRLALRTYERGVEDETLACGTGAAAAVLAASRAYGLGPEAWRVEAPGGTLGIRFRVEGERFTGIELEGPARRTFCGLFTPDNFTER